MSASCHGSLRASPRLSRLAARWLFGDHLGVLRYPRVYGWVLALSILLSMPALFADFFCDDGPLVLQLEGAAPAPVPGPFGLYTFTSGADFRARFVDHGDFPWWTASDLRLALFRPLSSALFALDHAAAGRHPLAYHLHSMVWYGVAVLAAARLFRRLLPEREAALASLLFAVAPAHWMVAAWPSARHIAISGTFALLAIDLHLRWRASGDERARWGALALATAALLGGETGLTAFAYVGSYELFGRPEALRARLRALAPWGLLALGYAGVYRAFGYGVEGSGGYIDPTTNPGRYLAAMPVRLAVYANAALLSVTAELSTIVPRAVPVLAVVGVLAAGGLALLVRRSWARLDEATRRTLRWILPGALLAILPGLASIPGDRVLFGPNVGVLAAIAVAICNAWPRGSTSALRAIPARAAVVLFAFAHVVLGPLHFANGAATLAVGSHAAMAAAAGVQIPPVPGVRVFGIGLSDPMVGMYLGPYLLLAPRADPPPTEAHVLTMTPHDERIRRVDDRTLEIAIDGGTLLETAFETVFRSTSEPLRSGDVVRLKPFSVRILDDIGGLPTRIAVSFDRSLDDPSIAFLVWQNRALRALSLPPSGREVLLRHERGPLGL
ncbi:MAG TPA: hypothetical protein VEK07_15510 [Polyangiaceae bacterium]|nr:hypothetical protein [Polyangiaceae bacterium]